MEEFEDNMFERNEYQVLEPSKYIDWRDVDEYYFENDDRFGGY